MNQQSLGMNIRLKQYLTFLLTGCLLLICFCSCNKNDDTTNETSFTGTIVEITEDTLLVAPDNDTQERDHASQIYVPINTSLVDTNGNELSITDLTDGMQVEITYDGVIEEGTIGTITSCFEIKVIS